MDMRKTILGLVIAAMMPSLAAAPADAQNRREIRREHRQDVREARRERRQALRDWRQSRRYDWNRLEPGQRYYYADRYYRDGRYYRERRLTRHDRIYRGSNGRYYCRRSDGTTGLIVGAALGGLLGHAIDDGRSSLLGTLIGAGAGAALGREIERGQVRCR
jgi:hypothetical protein